MKQPAARTLVLAALFCIPFVLLITAYHALPSEIPMLRTGIGHWVLVAPKSLFAVFRVPVMNLIHGVMACVMLSSASCFHDPERRAGYAGIFATLAFTVAIKANFEALEAVAPAFRGVLAPYANWLGWCTALSVAGGLGSAFFRSRKVPFPWPELRMSNLAKFALVMLFLGYLTIVAESFVISNSGSGRGA